jgi:hypothetical protein
MHKTQVTKNSFLVTVSVIGGSYNSPKYSKGGRHDLDFSITEDIPKPKSNLTNGSGISIPVTDIWPVSSGPAGSYAKNVGTRPTGPVPDTLTFVRDVNINIP